jgi:hypothetical protein
VQFDPIARRIGDMASVARLAGDIAVRRVAAAIAAAQLSDIDVLSGPLEPRRLADLAATAVFAEDAAAGVAAAPTLAAKLERAAAAMRIGAPSKPGIARDLARSVFRSIEVFGFAADLHVRYAQLDQSYLGGMAAIIAEHKAQCTCAD